MDDHADDLAEGVSWWSRSEEAFTDDEKLLACGAAVVSRLRAAVRSELNYSCTAGKCSLQQGGGGGPCVRLSDSNW